MKNIKIIVATHKKYRMPDDSIYLPVQVGAEGKESIGFQRDDEGDNISYKNPKYCELTGLYWAWKNLDCEYMGLSHYRRHFKNPDAKSKDAFDNVLDGKTLDSLFDTTDIVLTKKRNYYIETIHDHYANTMHIEPLDECGNIIKDKCPEYYPYFEKQMNGKTQHAFNMFVMKKELADEYCKWLFDILSELEVRFKDVEYDAFHSRFYGRVSERLLDVWINKNGYTYKEVPFIYMENVNKFKKVKGFLEAKFFKKKYGQSF